MKWSVRLSTALGFSCSLWFKTRICIIVSIISRNLHNASGDKISLNRVWKRCFLLSGRCQCPECRTRSRRQVEGLHQALPALLSACAPRHIGLRKCAAFPCLAFPAQREPVLQKIGPYYNYLSYLFFIST